MTELLELPTDPADSLSGRDPLTEAILEHPLLTNLTAERPLAIQ